jgi:diguanylate cyclase (GGDEF)-like protein
VISDGKPPTPVGLQDLTQFRLHILVLLILLLTAALDYVTGYGASMSAFYLVPIGLLAWYGRTRWCYPVALLAACLEQYTNEMAGEPQPHALVTLWNDVIALIHFVALVWLLRKVRSLLMRERQLSRVDFLTGLPNRMMLLERLQGELARCHREGGSLALGYIDLDHFKEVNDQHGHAEGDRLLKTISSGMRSCLRRGDILARLGGDEFAFVATPCQEGHARAVADKLLNTIANLSRVHGWPVTASVGLLQISDLKSVPSPESVLDAADALMYQAKSASRATVRIATWQERSTHFCGPTLQPEKGQLIHS